jgi:ribonuclease HI
MNKIKEPVVEIFTDGACSGNPGPGGYGAILKYSDNYKEISGYEPNTTNNRMELMAVIEALSHLKRACRVKVYSDSSYVINGMTKWISGWIKKKWINSQKKPVLNKDLWMRLLDLTRPHNIEWIWVKGHHGHIENERCDEMARNAIEKYRI